MKSKKLFQNFFKSAFFTQVLVIVIFLVGLFLFHWSFYKSELPATLTINFGESSRSFQGQVLGNMTILDALSVATSIGEIHTQYSIDEAGMVDVMKINNHTNNVGGKSFHFYLNTKEVEPANLARTNLQPGDNIEIKFE